MHITKPELKKLCLQAHFITFFMPEVADIDTLIELCQMTANRELGTNVYGRTLIEVNNRRDNSESLQKGNNCQK